MSDAYIVHVKNDKTRNVVTVYAETETDASVKAANKVGGKNIQIQSITKRDGNA